MVASLGSACMILIANPTLGRSDVTQAAGLVPRSAVGTGSAGGHDHVGQRRPFG
jgi:hypothetical protein